MVYKFNIIGSLDAATKATVQAALAEELTNYAPPATAPADAAADVSVTLCVDAEDSAFIKPNLEPYDARYVWSVGHGSAAEVVAVARRFLDSRAQASFISTRGGGGGADPSGEPATFLTVVRDGLAADGGLYILRAMPRMPAGLLRYYCTAHTLSYVDAAEIILEQLVDASMRPRQLYPLLLEAYAPERWSGLDNVCPVTPLLRAPSAAGGESVSGTWMENMLVLELYHGPTAAFKDFALQLFPRYFNVAVEETNKQKQKQQQQQNNNNNNNNSNNKDRYLILAATSGDTGVAAISGFVNAGGNSKVMVLYPMGGVSPVQQLQMLSYDDGRTVRVFGADSDFDFCQTTVKTIFKDGPLRERIAAETAPASVRLSSANSINWGRLIPQVAYYFWTYRQCVQARTVAYGDPIDVVVPCGNFGNILGAYAAKLMGLPLRRLVVASNTNDVLFSFVQTGVYDIRTRSLSQTASPSIDILKASNVERFLYLLSDGDTAAVKSYMEQLDTDGVFTISDAMRGRMQETFWADRCSEEECAAMIGAVARASGHRRILDPHTAVAVHVAKSFRETEVLTSGVFEASQPVVPLVVASTAHWAKFPEPVLHAIRGEAMELGAAVAPAAAAAHVRDLYAKISEAAGGAEDARAHPALVAAVESAEKAAAAAEPPRAVSANVDAVVAELETFAKVA